MKIARFDISHEIVSVERAFMIFFVRLVKWECIRHRLQNSPPLTAVAVVVNIGSKRFASKLVDVS